MALGFGRKKDAADAPESQTPTPPASAVTPAASNPSDDDINGKIDLDSFAAELASGGLTHEPPLDSALRTPPPSLDDDDSDFDSFGGESTIESLTEPEPLDLNKMFEVESRQAAAAGKAPAPFVPPSMANAPEPARPFYDPQIPIPPAKKPLPIIPIVAVLAVLGVAGIGAKFFMGSGEPEADTTVPTSNVAAANTAPGATTPGTTTPGAATPGSTAPGATDNTASAPTTPGEVSNSVTVPANVTGAEPTVPLTPELAAKLKALWNKGAAAKAAKDYAGARAAWEEALKLRPGHPGFAESIAKLPPQ